MNVSTCNKQLLYADVLGKVSLDYMNRITAHSCNHKDLCFTLSHTVWIASDGKRRQSGCSAENERCRFDPAWI